MEERLNVIKEKIITKADCIEILRSRLGKKVHLLDFSILKANNEAVGFLGDYFQLKTSFQSVTQVGEEVFFVKTEPISNENQRSFVRECGVLKKEAFLYEEILPKLSKACNLKFSPLSFLARENVLVLEDLDRENFKIIRRDYTLEDCQSLLKTLANFHSSSIVYELKSDGNSSLGKYIEKLPEGTFSFDDGNPKYEWLKCVTSCVMDLLRTIPSVRHEVIECKLKEIIFGGELEKLIKPSKKFRNVLTHNDLWSNNILHRENQECLLVDFQLVRYTPPAYDFLMAMFLNNSIEFLKENLPSLLVFYYNTFAKVLKNNELDPEEYFPLSEFLQSVEMYKTPALIEATMFAITVYLPEQKSSYIRSDSKRYQDYTFKNKTAYIMDSFLNDPKYRKKILGLLNTMAGIIQKKPFLNFPDSS